MRNPSAAMARALRPTPRDDRDFKLGAILGHAAVADLPDEYQTGEPLLIKDQGEGTDTCTAYALTAVSEDEEGVVLDPDFTFGATKQITGDPEAWGADLRSAAQSAVARIGAFGFLECADISKLTNPQTIDDRNAAARGALLTPVNVTAAALHAKKSFFAVDGPYDLFDNMRSALWQARAEKRSILTGCNWRTAWTGSTDGWIDQALPGQTFGHAVKAYGFFRDATGTERLKLQLSNGKGIGNAGRFYPTREVVNQAFQYGAFTFLDLPREDAHAACVAASTPRTFFGAAIARFFSTIKP